MRVIKLNQKGTAIQAIQNMALAISQGDVFEWAFETGLYMCDNPSEENEYTKLAANWKAGLLKVEVSKAVEVGNKITGWKTIVV